MDQFEKLQIAKSILSKRPGFLQQEFALAGADEEGAASDMGDKRTRHLPPIEESWDEDSLSRQGEEFDKEVSGTQSKSTTIARNTRSSSKKHKTSHQKEVPTFNLTFSLKNMPTHLVEEIRESILIGLSPILSSGILLNTEFELPPPYTESQPESTHNTSPLSPPEKKRKTKLLSLLEQE